MSTLSNHNQRSVFKGFSLVELMVSLSIFTIVMTISIGTLVVMLDANEKAQGEYYAMTNLTFAVDSMTREIRTGYNHYCWKSNDLTDSQLPTGSRDCGGGMGSNNFDKEIVFNRGRDGRRLAYRLNESSKQIEQRVSLDADGNGGSWLSITSPDIGVNRFDIRVEGSTGGDEDQPKITLFMDGFIKNGLDEDYDFRLQTDITQRVLDY